MPRGSRLPREAAGAGQRMGKRTAGTALGEMPAVVSLWPSRRVDGVRMGARPARWIRDGGPAIRVLEQGDVTRRCADRDGAVELCCRRGGCRRRGRRACRCRGPSSGPSWH